MIHVFYSCRTDLKSRTNNNSNINFTYQLHIITLDACTQKLDTS